MDLIAKGAEANLYRDGDSLVKERVEKKYRLTQLDNRLRKARTKHEAKILKRLEEAGVSAPRLIEEDLEAKTIVMEYIDGVTLKEEFSKVDEKKIKKLGGQIGELIADLHENHVIHNDLTTSNLILKDGKIFLIDFGLSFVSHRLEDFAMDIVVFRKSLYASHPKNADKIWEAITSAYEKNYKDSKSVFNRTKTIEKRVRYA
ncbi:MAG: KEOPS complex kinase/ATPase Bud32 [Candidatus Altiarchaeota archaeon]